MKLQPIAQGKAVDQLVRRDVVVPDHLRLRPELGVERKWCVEHHVAVRAGDAGSRPDRVEHAKIRRSNQTKRLCTGALRPRAKSKSGKPAAANSRRVIPSAIPFLQLLEIGQGSHVTLGPTRLHTKKAGAMITGVEREEGSCRRRPVPADPTWRKRRLQRPASATRDA